MFSPIGTIVTVFICTVSLAPSSTSASDICKPSKVPYNVYYPGDCKNYYVCQDGKETLNSCGILHYFDEISNSCKLYVFLLSPVDCSAAENADIKPTDKATTKTASEVNPSTTIKPTETTTPGTTTSGTKPSGTTPSNTEQTTTKKGHNDSNQLHASQLTSMFLLGLSIILSKLFS